MLVGSPLEDLSGGSRVPVQEGDRVVESEHGFIVFDIVAVEKLPYFLELIMCELYRQSFRATYLFVTSQIHSDPFEAFEQALRLLWNPLRINHLDWSLFELLGSLICRI